MLRRKSPPAEATSVETKGFVPYPALAESFVLGHAPAGIHFYAPQEAFYLPYASLQAMRFHSETLTLVFAMDEVIVEGRGLHSLYVQIADQKVKRVYEQGERYKEADDAPIFILRVQRKSRDNAA